MAIGRRPDRDRILLLLSASEGLSKSNLRVKTELNLGDDRYQALREELIKGGLIEKTSGRGGGIRLTRKGERELPGDEDQPGSMVANVFSRDAESEKEFSTKVTRVLSGAGISNKLL